MANNKKSNNKCKKETIRRIKVNKRKHGGKTSKRARKQLKNAETHTTHGDQR